MEQLSKRETEVLTILAKGSNNKALANELNISLATVKTHLRHIYVKINVKSRTEAVLYYVNSKVK